MAEAANVAPVGQELTLVQRARERSVAAAVIADAAISSVFVVVGVLGGSLTILAESIRCWLMLGIEIYSLAVMRRIHRNKLSEFDFGTGKLEQICNLLIAAGMILSALWIAHGAVGLAISGSSKASPLGLSLAAVSGAFNTLINFLAWGEMRAAAAQGRSVIMQAQLHARVTKLVSSAIVQLTMTLAALTGDPVVVAWLDSIGALFVAAYIMVTAVPMLRAGLPEMLDRSVDETTQLAVLRVLSEHDDLYAWLGRIRTRRSGAVVFVEIAIGLDAQLPLAEVDRRVDLLRTSFGHAIEGVDLSIVVTGRAADRTSPPANA
jgi:divalent metal cation (Fe/Co/Zn/Cd) transporter